MEFPWLLVFAGSVVPIVVYASVFCRGNVRTLFGVLASDREQQRSVAGVTDYVTLVRAGRSNLTDPH